MLIQVIGLMTSVVSTLPASAKIHPSIRQCRPSELTKGWVPPAIKPGTVMRYEVGGASLGEPMGYAVRLDGATDSEITTTEAPAPSGSLSTAVNNFTANSNQKRLFGFVPLRYGLAGGIPYRRTRYDERITNLWMAAPGTTMRGRVEEFSHLPGGDRTTVGSFTATLIGCADVAVGSGAEAAKVFRLTKPARSVDAHAVPPVERVRITETTSYVSLRRGLLLRQETKSGYLQIR